MQPLPPPFSLLFSFYIWRWGFTLGFFSFWNTYYESPGWPETHYLDLVSLKFRDLNCFPGAGIYREHQQPVWCTASKDCSVGSPQPNHVSFAMHNLHFLHVFICVWECKHLTLGTNGGWRTLQKLVLFPPLCSFQDKTQVIKLGTKSLQPLSHLGSPWNPIDTNQFVNSYDHFLCTLSWNV